MLTKSLPIIISIAGASGSGKSSVAQNIYDDLKKNLQEGEICIISEDSYYKDQKHLSLKQRALTNFDHPDAFDYALLSSHIDELKKSNTIKKPIYNFKTHLRKQATWPIKATKVIILEGILLLHNAELRARSDLKIYIDTALDICLMRRATRDIQQRGRTLDDIAAQYISTVRPMYKKYIEPSKTHADIIIPKGAQNKTATQIIAAAIKEKIK